MFPCHKCGKDDGLTIRGLCASCDPQAHADYHLSLDFIGEADKAYKARTGKNSLAEWDDFEKFLGTYIADKPNVLAAFGRELDARGVRREEVVSVAEGDPRRTSDPRDIVERRPHEHTG